MTWTQVRRAAWATLLAGLAWVVAAGAAAADDDAAWRDRIDKQVRKLEAATAELDAQAPSGRTLVQRVVALDARIRVLETANGLAAGSVRADADLDLLTLDVTILQTRLNTLHAPRAPKKEPAPVAPAPDRPKPGDAPAPQPSKPAGTAWPAAVRFLATAKFSYTETGTWYTTTDDLGIIHRDFLMDGYQGTLGFSLRAANLKQDVRAVVVRVGIRMKDPFATEASAYRVVDVRWDAANRLFGNDSLKTFPAHDILTVRGPIRWIDGPQERSMAVTAEAWVLSATLKGGEELTFEPPKFDAK